MDTHWAMPRLAAVLSCDECGHRGVRADWVYQGTSASGARWRAVVCDGHFPLLRDEIRDQGGSGSLELLPDLQRRHIGQRA